MQVVGIPRAAIWRAGLGTFLWAASLSSSSLAIQVGDVEPEAPAPAQRVAPRFQRAAAALPLRRINPAIANRAAQAAAADEAEARGALDDLNTVISAIIDVKMQNDRLELVPIAGFREFQQALYSNAGVFGGGGTSSSGNGREMVTSINWQRLTGIARISQQAPADGELLFSENDHLRRSLQCRWTADGQLLFSILSPSEPLYIELQVGPNKPISLVYLAGARGDILRSESFTEILQALDSDSRQIILSTIRKLGLPLPATPYEQAVMQAVRDRLAMVVSDDEMAEFRTFTQGFDDNSFEARETCSAQLKADFERWRPAIILALDDESFSLEARSRMREIFREKVSEEEREVMETAVDSNLDSNPEYLAFLLSDTSAEEAGPVLNRLKLLTGEDHGSDVEAWTAAVSADSTESETEALPSPTLPTGSFEPSRLEALSSKISRIARFEIIDGALVLDQTLWKDGYGDQTISDVNAEIKQKLDQFGLPAMLWQGEQLSGLGEAAYPVARVMALESDVLTLPNAADMFIQSRMQQTVSPNPQFTLNGIMVRLVTQSVMNPQRQAQMRQAQAVQVPEEPTRYDFTIAELTERKRELRFGCSQTGDSCYCVYRESNSGLLLIVSGSRDQGWNLQLVTEDGGLIDHDSDMQALVDRNSELFTKFIGPRLQEVGIQTPWASASSQE